MSRNTADDAVIPLEQVTRTRLENGMTVLVSEDHGVPVATVTLWVKTGYFNETDEWTGISHLLEHMFFKGTTSRPVGTIKDEIKGCGGISNAATIYDHTSYYVVLPSTEIFRGMDIMADALQRSIFLQEDLDKEQEVVIQEVLRKHDRPATMAWERMAEMTFTRHYFGRWRMGRPDQIRAMNHDVMVGYHTGRYRPENIILVVAGDVDTAQIQEEAARLFGEMPRGVLQEHSSPLEPPQKALRYREETSDISQAHLAIGFQAPPLLADDEAAVVLLGHILGTGKSARLYRALRERAGLVNQIDADYYGVSDAGVFFISAELPDGNLEAARNAIFVELERIRRLPPAAEELERVKTRLELGALASMEGVGGQAMELARFEAQGDYRLINRWFGRLRAVTANDVRRAAEKYLRVGTASIQVLRPGARSDDSQERNPEVSGAEARSVEAAIREAVAAEVEGESTPGEEGATRVSDGPVTTGPDTPRRAVVDSTQGLSGVTVGSAAQQDGTRTRGEPFGVHKLSNGIAVILQARPRLPLVSFAIAFGGGRHQEALETAGLTRLMLSTSLKGTTTRDAETLQDQLALLGTSIVGVAGADSTRYAFRALSRNFAQILEIMDDVLSKATFPAEEVEKERKTQLARISRSQDNMSLFPMQLAREAAFQGHPYGLPVLGNEASVRRLTREQILTHHARTIRASGAVVSVVGDVDQESVLALLEHHFGDLPAGDGPLAAPSAPIFNVDEKVVIRDRAQSAQAFVFPAPPADSTDAPALAVLRGIIGGLGGRLFDEVRDRNNLAYTVFAQLQLYRTGGLLLSYAATSPENEERALALMLEVWRDAAAGGLTLEEVDASKQYVIGTYQIGLQTNSGLVGSYLHNHFVGRGPEHVTRYPELVRQVTFEQVQAIAAKYAAPDGHALGVVRSASR